MPKISSRKWKEALTAIIDELEKSQFNKMLELLRKIPRSQKTPKFKDKMPQKIIEHYGEEKSISAINRVMSKIPRKDAVIQDQLRPFVLTLKKKKLKEKKGQFLLSLPHPHMSRIWSSTIRMTYMLLDSFIYNVIESYQ